MAQLIKASKDIKKLSYCQLAELAQQIRTLIIQAVAKNGGHLASSLGAVELCLALHYCFEFLDKDSLIFDVGHQVYAHKIITGRGDKFMNLRKKGGVSGFPDPSESAHDVYISGHASTAISWAQGISVAKKYLADNSKTVAVIGDGSLTGGMCFEALNSCGHNQNDVLVILNHNEMSISTSVGALSNYLTKIISLPIYNRIKEELESYLDHLPQFTKRIFDLTRRFEEAVKSLMVPGVFFEELGFRYFGPLDGHNLPGLISAIKNIKPIKGPKLLHIITKKGKGYRFAEENPESFHSARPFIIDKGIQKKQKKSFSAVFGETLVKLAKKDTRIMAITAAMTKGTGLSAFAKEFPQRCFDVGIAESHAVGMASGLAKQGLKPVVAIYSTFLQRSFDQIIHDVALQDLGVVFAIDRAGFVGADGPTHHGVFDIAYMRMIPGIVGMAPKDEGELKNMLAFAVASEKSCALRYPKLTAYNLNSSFAADYPLHLGKAEIISQGSDICILALGSMVQPAQEALEVLAQHNIKPTLVNMRFFKPLDKALLLEVAKEYSKVVTVEEGVASGGFGSSVLEFYQKHDLLSQLCIKNLAIKDEFSPFASRQQLLRQYCLDASGIAQEVVNLNEKNNHHA